MNRSVLIVICDFLLVSLLAFSTVDIEKVAEDGKARPVSMDISTNLGGGKQDVGNALKLALDEERRNRDQLMGELARTRDSLGRQQVLLTGQQTLLREREKQIQEDARKIEEREKQIRAGESQIHEREQQIEERGRQIQSFQQQLVSSEEKARRLQQEEAGLRQQASTALTNIQGLNQQLRSNSIETLLTKEELAAKAAELRNQMNRAAELQQQLAQLETSNQLAAAEKQRLSGQLLVAETEKRAAADQAAHMREEVKIEREEKAKLAEGLKTLAVKSSELTQEIRSTRGMAANMVFNDFASNSVQAHFEAFRTGFLGLDTSKRRDAETVLVTDGTNIFALSHVQDTPLAFADPGSEWESLTGTLFHDLASCPVASVSFCRRDPRVILIPVTAAQARALGCRVYQIAADPFKFPDAVVVGTRESYYGECKFQVELATPDYLKMDHNSLKGLFGQFNPSRGDLVFSKGGELLGVMANNSYCMLVHNFNTMAMLQFGPDVRSQHTGWILSQLHSHVALLPFQLQ